MIQYHFRLTRPASRETSHCLLQIPDGLSWAPFDWTFGPGFAYK